jgi:hypothetical protein
MDVNWQDPDIVSLHERLAACIQDQLEQDLTAEGRVADQPYFGARVATEIFHRAQHVDVMGSSGEWTLVFTADPPPAWNTTYGCVTCGAREGHLHDQSYCSRRGVQRAPGVRVEL